MNTTVSENASTNFDNTSRLSFHHSGDYFLPDLAAPEAPRIGKFGTLRHEYLRTWHRGIFDGMLLKGTLYGRLCKSSRVNKT